MRSNDRPTGRDVSTTERLSVGGLLAFDVLLLGALLFAIHPRVAVAAGLGALSACVLYGVAGLR